MREDLEARLRGPLNFPSPPGVAQHIIELSQDPEIDVTRIADLIGTDPGLAAKILRTANSPIYAQRRRSQNLRQAVLVLGLNATVTLALSFSIVAGLRNSKKGGMDYPAFWRRTLLAATAARACGELIGLHQTEDLFLAALLQDIGQLALDRSRPGFYDELGDSPSEAQLLAFEKKNAGEDHAPVGAWMLRNWNLPEHLCHAVELSHQPERAGSGSESGRFVRCAALAGELAAMFVSSDRASNLSRLVPRAAKLLGLRSAQLTEVINAIAHRAPETERLFEINLLDGEDAGLLMEQAREILALRNLQSLSEIDALKQTTDSLAARTEALEDANRRDGLTGVLNRATLDERLASEFDSARKSGWPLSIAFIDLDHFKRINDTHGHQAGDRVLRSVAQLLMRTVRDSDIVGRYGGEEFVVIFPGLDQEGAHGACERLLEAIRATTHDLGGCIVTATASLGMATQSAQKPFAGAAKLVHAADMAVYAAKHNGRNRVEVFRPGSAEQPALAG
jgi:diguanylate cyclase (GGDEF)-like protein